MMAIMIAVNEKPTYHCNITPAMNGTSRRTNGAVFQTGIV